MPHQTPAAPPARWTIQSVAIRARDGPQRLDQAYHLVLAAPPPGVGPGAHCPADRRYRNGDGLEGKEPGDACRDLCPRLDRPPRA